MRQLSIVSSVVVFLLSGLSMRKACRPFLFYIVI